MRTIWKYPLQIAGRNVLTVPAGARFLCVQIQRGEPCVWAEVDTEMPGEEVREVLTVATGDVRPVSPWRYIGTYQSGSFVGHVYG